MSQGESGIQELLASESRAPACVLDHQMNIVAATGSARALSMVFEPGENLLRSIFLDPSVYDAVGNWHRIAETGVAWLRARSATARAGSAMVRLVGEISLRSPQFRNMWARPAAAVLSTGRLLLDHEVTGSLDLTWHFRVVADPPGHAVLTIRAVPGSSSAKGLLELAGMQQLPG